MSLVSQVLGYLTSLYTETKRKNSTVRKAIEAAQNEALKVPLASPIADLPQHTQYTLCSPFLLGLDPKHPKMWASAMQKLFQLASTGSMPENCVHEALLCLLTHQGAFSLEMQLKTLQFLPFLVLNYNLKRGDFLVVLEVAARPLNASGVVLNTAAATLHQIFSSLFDKLKKSALGELKQEAMWMCSHVMADLCSILVAGKPTYFSTDVHFSCVFALEVLENILHVNGRQFHVELHDALKDYLFPSLFKLAQTKSGHFPTLIRCFKLFYLLTQFEKLGDEIAAFLSLTNRLALSESSAYWQHVAVVELYGSILLDFARIRVLYENKGDMVEGILAVLGQVILADLFQLNGHSLFADRICIPTENGPVLAKSSSLKIQVIDHLDRSEPPVQVPELYTPNLVLNSLLAYANGVSKFVTALSSDEANLETLEADVEFVTSLNESVFPQVMGLFQKFVYASMSLDYFHLTVRFIQRYTHAIGLLGLSKQRDDILKLLADCIVNSPQKEVPPLPAPNSNLLALGGSIVESLTSMQVTERERGDKSASERSEYRSFSSRQALCLRALVNLANSLGSTLRDSWKVIWVALQWAEYFINGPESNLGRRETSYGVESTLSPNELAGIENLKHRFFESVEDYQESSIAELVQALVNLYELGNEERAEELAICPYNKSYLLNTLTKIAKLEFTNIALFDSEVWDRISEFFFKISTNRSTAYENRAFMVECFTSIIIEVTKRGFTKPGDSTESLAQKSLAALNEFLERLLAQGMPKENMVLNCETEMHLTILSTLHGLIDEYDKYYQNSWDVVFRILNTAFVKTNVENKNLGEKIQRLISTSFDTLKLILDEFTSTLPFNQLKPLIDSLVNFCSQTYDLNISFSAVSYFWLISDCIHSEGKEMGDQEAKLEIYSLDDLVKFLTHSSTGNGASYQALTIYLLAQLSTLSTDIRDQVREGAIQTLFQILDVRGKQLHSWELIYDIVFPALFNVPQDQKISRKSLVESYNLTLSGLVSVYGKYMTDFYENPRLTEKFWRRIIEFFSMILHLHWNELDFLIFQSFKDILLSLNQVEVVPSSIVELLFEFWASVSINYDFVQPEYQETLATYNDTFRYLYKLLEEMSVVQASRAMLIMNKCVKYPVLKPGMNDESRPSSLQKAVYENLQMMLELSDDKEICALVIQQLADISAFPYGIKSRIEKKLKSKFEGKLKIPSFLAISQLSIDLLSRSLNRLPELEVLLLGDFQFGKIVRSLMESVYNQERDMKPDPKALWVKSNDVIAQLVVRLVDENSDKIGENKEVWKVLVECLLANFQGNNGDYDVKQYEKLSTRILPQFFQSGHHDLIREFITQVYLQSYVYEANGIERELIDVAKDEHENEIYSNLSAFQFEESFGSTQKCQVKDNREIRLKCLSELLKFPKRGGYSSQVTKDLLLTRVSFSLRRFVADERLLGSRPLPQIQEQELLIILDGFLEVAKEIEKAKLEGVIRLLERGVEYTERIAGLEVPMKAILALGR